MLNVSSKSVAGPPQPIGAGMHILDAIAASLLAMDFSTLSTTLDRLSGITTLIPPTLQRKPRHRHTETMRHSRGIVYQ